MLARGVWKGPWHHCAMSVDAVSCDVATPRWPWFWAQKHAWMEANSRCCCLSFVLPCFNIKPHAQKAPADGLALLRWTLQAVDRYFTTLGNKKALATEKPGCYMCSELPTVHRNMAACKPSYERCFVYKRVHACTWHVLVYLGGYQCSQQLSVFPVPGNFTRPSRNCTCNKKYSACGSQVCFSFGPTTYSVYLLNCLSLGSSSMTKSKMAPNMCSTRTVGLPVNFYRYLCMCVCVSVADSQVLQHGKTKTG